MTSERAEAMTETILDIIDAPGDWVRVRQYIETELMDYAVDVISEECMECDERA